MSSISSKNGRESNISVSMYSQNSIMINVPEIRVGRKKAVPNANDFQLDPLNV